MSKLKQPAEKKEASYEHDRRHAEGENNKASRKAVPLAKARAKRQERHSVHQALVQPEAIDADDAEEVEAEAEVIETAVANTRLKRLKGFKKVATVPLGELVEEKLAKKNPAKKATAGLVKKAVTKLKKVASKKR